MICYLRLLRVHQWLKNLMLFFPPFLSGALLHPALLQKGVLPVASFCLASSATYVFNALMDAEGDRHHPVKRLRPVACGEVSLPGASLFALILATAGLLCGWLVPGNFLAF